MASSENTDPTYHQILGVRFFNGPAKKAVEIGMGGGLVVVPSAPVLLAMVNDSATCQALLNSDLCQTDRETVMARMKAGHQRLLVATDIAARGIDISFLPCVIHYDLPDDVQQYIHRTGRTGRVDRHGRAISLLTLKDTTSRRISSRGLALPGCVAAIVVRSDRSCTSWPLMIRT